MERFRRKGRRVLTGVRGKGRSGTRGWMNRNQAEKGKRGQKRDLKEWEMESKE